MRKAITHLRRADPVLGGLIESIGPLRLQYLEPDFEALAKSIVYQQLNGKAARTIYQRLAAAVGDPLTPASVLRLRSEKLRAVGLSRQKITYLRDLAACVRDGRLDLASLNELPDQEVIQQLTRVKGIGVWTAQMFLIFALRRPDVLPVGDFGVQSAIRKAYGLKELPGAREIERIGRPWRPWSSVATWYLWRSLDGDAGF